MRRRAAVPVLLLVALAGCAEFRARFAGPDVVFIATPEDVAVAMLRLAEVGPRDVVVDLGSGDGRLVIAAAREFGARGIGVDIDPELVATSRLTARSAGVADRTTFLQQDLFVTELHTASVVTLYLRDDVNLRLRPRLLRELAPGSRVVSHDFDMGDWRADRTQRVRGPLRDHRLYLWVVPVPVAGIWRLRLGEREALLNLTQRYQELGGTLSLEGRELAVSGGRISGERLAFTAGARLFEGRAAGDALDGESGGLIWSARRIR
ncbi:MAG TPA: methyltransferase domain-containing protein [Methylomirabilota bacterium]